MLAPGPNGIPNRYQTTNKIIQVIKKIIEYGSMSDTTVPIPLFLPYRCAKATINGKNGMSGETTFVVESPILYAA